MINENIITMEHTVAHPETGEAGEIISVDGELMFRGHRRSTQPDERINFYTWLDRFNEHHISSDLKMDDYDRFLEYLDI